MPVAAVPVVVVAWIELGLDLHLAYCLPVVVAYVVAVVLDVVVVTFAAVAAVSGLSYVAAAADYLVGVVDVTLMAFLVAGIAVDLVGLDAYVAFAVHLASFHSYYLNYFVVAVVHHYRHLLNY